MTRSPGTVSWQLASWGYVLQVQPEPLRSPLALGPWPLALGSPPAMSAFTYERDLDHPVSAEVEQTIRDVLEKLLSSHGLEGVLVNPGLDHDGDPVLFVHLKFRLVEPGIDPNLISQSTLSVRRALWAIGERRFPHLRYDFHDDQRILGTENW